MKIYLVGKNIYSIGITENSVKNVNLALMVYDENNSPQNYIFEQTESLTENFIGITDYGLITFNSNTTDLEAEVLIRTVNGDDVVEKTVKVMCLMKTEAGNEIGTGCGGGGESYTAGYGIEISEENEISVDLNEIATRDDIENLEESKQDKLVSGESIKTVNNLSLLGKGNIDTGFVANYGETTAQEIVAYIDQFPDKISSVIVKRGSDYYSTILTVKQADNKVLLKCIGSASGNYYLFTYTVTDGTWASNSQGLQNLLVSGENIKTVNNQSLLGSGNIDISGGGSVFVARYNNTPASEIIEAVKSGAILLVYDATYEIPVGEKFYLMAMNVLTDETNVFFECVYGETLISYTVTNDQWDKQEKGIGGGSVFVAEYNVTPTSEIVEAVEGGAIVVLYDSTYESATGDTLYLFPVNVFTTENLVYFECIYGGFLITYTSEHDEWSKDEHEISFVNTVNIIAEENREVYIGDYRDIDGAVRKLYRKVIPFTKLPNNGEVKVMHNITRSFTVTSLSGTMRDATGTAFFPLPLVTTDPTKLVYLSCGKINVTIQTLSDRSSYSATVTVEYFYNEL